MNEITAIRLTLLTLIANVLAVTALIGQSWQQCSSLPEAMAPSAVAVNGKIYAFRGNNFYSGNLTEPSSMYEYDPLTNVWIKKGTMNTLRTLSSLIELNGKIYAIGGVSNNTYATSITMADVEAYDIATGNWQVKSRLPKSLYVFGLVTVQGKIYVLGGSNKTMINGTRKDSTSNQLYEYTPESDTWTTKANMLKHRSWSDAVTVNNKIYAIGGNNGIPLSGENTIEEYDIASDSWTQRATFTNGFDGQCQAVVMNGKIYTLSSDIISTGAFTKALIGEYDPATGTWVEKTQMLSPIMDFGKVVCNNQLYMMGGHLVSGMTFSNKVIKYDPATNSQLSLPDISQWYNAVVETGGMIYAVGGVNNSGSYINRVIKYDTKNDATPVQKMQNKPESFLLEQNYPNPFNPTTRIVYRINKNARVDLTVYDLLGQKIATLIDEEKAAGEHSVNFDASRYCSGVYYYSLSCDGFYSARKMLIMK
jgi:N-acetylneuraminic acid mutarotase